MKHRIFAALVVLGPAALWLGGLAVVLLSRLIGCEISAQGPKLCVVWGVNIGDQLHPLSAVGFYGVYALLWVPIGLIVLGVSRHLSRIDLS